MKKFCTIFLISLAALVSSVKGNAQIVISASDLIEATSYTVEAQVVDSLTNEPISFASVYLMPKKDTLITNFSLTDTLGNAVLKEVTRGEYEFHAEFLGYKPYIETMYIRADRNLKTIRLQPDLERLEAARVSAVGEAIEFRQDTIIYNASSFRSLAGDNLGDLLKKMPGIEVGENGDVKVNGKTVSKITVNGKTFFMDDNKTTLDNLPATFVNKVKVTEKDSDEAEFTGIRTGSRETEMDVELKDEYKKGVFGNIKMAGGTAVRDKDDNEFVADMPFIGEASTMVSAYGEKNQLTTIANAKNVIVDDNVAMVIIMDGGTADELNLGFDGLQSGWSVGSNLNSDAVKGLNSTASVMFSHGRADKKNASDRTTFMDQGEDLTENQNSEGFSTLDHFNFNFELENKDRKKYSLTFLPKFAYKRMDENSVGTSLSSVGSQEKNHSESFSSSSMEQYSTGGYISLGVRDLGKKRRSLTLTGNYSFQNTFGGADDISKVWFAGSADPSERNLHYDKDNHYYRLASALSYVEPLGDNWSLNASFDATYTSRDNVSDAFNADGTANDYYTSVINNRYKTFGGDLLAQYSKNGLTLYGGLNMDFIENYNYARSYGLDTETGKDDWQRNISPYLRLQLSKKIYHSIMFSSSSSQPQPSNIIPTFNIVNPTRLSLGNIYLKPSFRNSLSYDMNGKAGNVSLSLWTQLTVNDKASVSATWFDENSIRYSIPVNSLKPQYSASVSGSLSIPLNKEKTLSLSYTPNFSLSRSTGYQASGILGGIDADKFEYSDFMDSFWGDASGNRFYSGESGFRESLTKQSSISNTLNLRLNFENFNMRTVVSSSNNRSAYSLDPKANTSTWRHRFSLYPEYTAPHEITVTMDMSYSILRGYGSGYDRNFTDLGLKIQKSFKAFSFALAGRDLLNAADSHSFTVADDYVQNSYELIMGRRIYFQFTWNFGKMNAARSNAARSASFDMLR